MLRCRKIALLVVVIVLGLFQAAPAGAAAEEAAAVPEDLAAAGIDRREWASIDAQIAQASYHFAWQTLAGEGAYRAPNQAQGWGVSLGAGGLGLAVGDAALRLNVASWDGLAPGGGALSAVDAEAMRHFDSLVEKVTNSPDGAAYQVEIFNPAAGDAGVLAYQVQGDLALVESNSGMEVLNDAGQVVLRLGDLDALDDSGRTLDAQFLAMEDGLGIAVDGLTGADYPIRISMAAFGQTIKLLAGDGEDEDRFGRSVAVSGDVIVVGAYGEDSGGVYAGAAYVFHRMKDGPDTWGQVEKIVGIDTENGDWFGFSVAVSGDVIVVGARYDNGVVSDTGAAYVFQRRKNGADQWDQVQKLTASDAEFQDNFGYAVGVYGDVIVVGARYEDEGGHDAGAAYVFHRMKNGIDQWDEVQKLTASGAGAGEYFGNAVAVWGDVIVIGAPLDDAGAGYVFQRMKDGGDTWGEVGILLASDGESDDEFGASVAVWGDVIVVGAPYEADNGTDAGAAYVFHRREGGVDSWDQIQKLIASDADGGEEFGWSVSVSADVLVVGARKESTAVTQAGAAYVFERARDGSEQWLETDKLTASDAETGDGFGESVAVSGDVIAIGALFEDQKATDSGAVYLFQNVERVWIEEVKSLASTPEAGAWYGRSVAVSGDVLVIGAYREGSGEGAVYVLHRMEGGGNSWGNITKLSASNLEASDGFGFDVAVWGDVIVVGAPNDDQGTTVNTGEVYVYHRMEGGVDNWGEVQRLTSSQPAENGFYGYSVDVWGDVIVVGAWREGYGGVTACGAAYVYHRMQGGVDTWAEVQRLVSTHTETGGGFGWSVAVWGDVIVIGAMSEGTGGAAYVHQRMQGGGDNWGLVQRLTAVVSAGAYFGNAVDVWGDVIVVSAYLDDGGASNRGKAFVFQRMQGGVDNWAEVAHLAPNHAQGDAYFGQSLAMWGDVIVIGANAADGAALDTGAAYVYQRLEGGVDAWGLTQTLGATDAETDDGYGVSVAISGGVLVVGANNEDCGATDGGAAYVYLSGPTSIPTWIIFTPAVMR
jgi:hypothetical protein